MQTIENYRVSLKDKLEMKVRIAIQAIETFIERNKTNIEYRQIFKSFVLYEILHELEDIEKHEKFLSSESRIDYLINRATDEVMG